MAQKIPLTNTKHHVWPTSSEVISERIWSRKALVGVVFCGLYQSKKGRKVKYSSQMSKLYKWEKIVMAVVAVASFFAGYRNEGVAGFFNGIMAAAINSLIIYAIFRIGNKVYNSRKKQNS